MVGAWTRCNSTAVSEYRYLPEDKVLQIVFRDGSQAYDYPCDALTFSAFEAARSKGRFVDRVLRPRVQGRG